MKMETCGVCRCAIEPLCPVVITRKGETHSTQAARPATPYASQSVHTPKQTILVVHSRLVVERRPKEVQTTFHSSLLIYSLLFHFTPSSLSFILPSPPSRPEPSSRTPCKSSLLDIAALGSVHFDSLDLLPPRPIDCPIPHVLAHPPSDKPHPALTSCLLRHVAFVSAVTPIRLYAHQKQKKTSPRPAEYF